MKQKRRIGAGHVTALSSFILPPSSFRDMLHCPTCGRDYPAGTRTCPQDNTPLQADSTVATSRGELPSDPLIGLVLDDKYRLDERLGEGGMGTVYRATHLLIERPVAVKVLNPRLVSDAATHERFRREARAAGRLRHTNAVAVTDFGETSEGITYIVMELLEGESLRELLARDSPLDPAHATSIMLQAAAAVSAAHETGVIHRDLKPGNIFIVRRPNAAPIIKVLDFGIAKVAIDANDPVKAVTLTETGVMIGTPRYMSPEQCDGRPLTPASDVYSLGIIFYELLTGVTPFNGPTPLAVALKQSSELPRPPREIVATIPPQLEHLVMHALEKRPEDRPSNAGEFARELHATAQRLGFEHAAGFSQPTVEMLRDAGTETPSGRLVIDIERLRGQSAAATAQNPSTPDTAEEHVIRTGGSASASAGDVSPPAPVGGELMTASTVVAAHGSASRVHVPLRGRQTWGTHLRNPIVLIGISALALVIYAIALLAFVSSRTSSPAVSNANRDDESIGRMDDSNTSGESESSDAAAPSPPARPPQTAEEFVARGAYLASARDYDAAIRDYRRALELQNDYPTAHNRLGVALLMKNQLTEAAQEFRVAVEQREGNYPTAQFNLGYALQRQGFRNNDDAAYNQAVAAYAEAIEQRGGNYPDAYYQIGLIHLNQRRDAEATDALRRAVEQNNGRDPDAQFYLGVSLLRQRYFDEAEAALRTSIEQRSRKMTDAQYALGRLYEDTNRPAEAVREYENYLQQPNVANRREIEARLRELRQRAPRNN